MNKICVINYNYMVFLEEEVGKVTILCVKAVKRRRIVSECNDYVPKGTYDSRRRSLYTVRKEQSDCSKAVS